MSTNNNDESIEDSIEAQIENDIVEQQQNEQLQNESFHSANEELPQLDNQEQQVRDYNDIDFIDIEDNNQQEEDEEDDVVLLYEVLDSTDEDEDDDEDRAETDQDDYENVQKPDQINYDKSLPSSHAYLGQNFEEIAAPRVFHQESELLTIPILALPGANLLPGAIMPLCVYAPLQVNMIKNRIESSNGDPTIGFIIRSDNIDSQAEIYGTLAEIISSKNEDNDPTSPLPGLLLKVKGRERFKIVKLNRDITGCAIADVRIMPEFVLFTNPLKINTHRNTRYLLDEFLNDKLSLSQAEKLNLTPIPAWIYRQYDCSYLMNVILKELQNSYDATQLPSMDKIPSEPQLFSNWLLTNFPFDDQVRLNVLKLDCINQRLRYIHSILKSYSSINCRICRTQVCSKSDVFSMCTQGFMNAYVNAYGHIHETLTVYKTKNLTLIGRQSTEYSWFPGYAWTIVQCKRCSSHIGWKFTATKTDLKPDKFWGLTRKAVCHTNETIEQETQRNNLNGQSEPNIVHIPIF